MASFHWDHESVPKGYEGLKKQEIEAFLAVCKYGTFTKAAEKCYTTQPNISWQIASLEKEMGCQFFIRGKGIRKFTLTREGELFLPQAEKFLRLWRETEDILAADAFQKYSFHCVPSIASLVIPRIFQMFNQKEPECMLSQSSSTSSQICSDVEFGHLDCGLACNTRFMGEVSAVPVAAEPVEFVCLRRSAYEGIQRVENLDTTQQIYIQFSEELLAWQKRQFPMTDKVRPMFSGTLIPNPRPLFQSADAWAIVPKSYRRFNFPEDQFKMFPIEPTPPERRFLLVSQTPPREPYYSMILGELRRIFDENPDFRLL